MNISRRHFLAASGLWVVAGCRPDQPPKIAAPQISLPTTMGGGGQCHPTAANIEGPYFKAGAPDRRVLARAGADGSPLSLALSVRDRQCRSIPNVAIEIWHADHRGGYDNTGYTFRGATRSDPRGEVALQTIVPGRYLNGATYRPAHIHVKLAAPGFRPLTTQLYFPGDPYNDEDPFIHPSLIMQHEAGRGRYDFVLSES